MDVLGLLNTPRKAYMDGVNTTSKYVILLRHCAYKQTQIFPSHQERYIQVLILVAKSHLLHRAKKGTYDEFHLHKIKIFLTMEQHGLHTAQEGNYVGV